MATVKKYRLWCGNDNRYEYVWSEAAPTTCPVNSVHVIDPNKTSIVKEITSNEVIATIKEEFSGVKTGNNYQVYGIEMTIPAANGKTTKDISWPVPVSVLAASFMADPASIGDCVDAEVSPDTIIGALTAQANDGSVVMNVSQTVIDNVKIGYYLNFGGQGLGRIKTIDAANLKVTMENAVAGVIAAAAAVKMTVKMIVGLSIGGDKLLEMGGSKIGGSYLPAGTVLRLVYDNKTGTAKKFRPVLELLY